MTKLDNYKDIVKKGQVTPVGVLVHTTAGKSEFASTGGYRGAGIIGKSANVRGIGLGFTAEPLVDWWGDATIEDLEKYPDSFNIRVLSEEESKKLPPNIGTALLNYTSSLRKSPKTRYVVAEVKEIGQKRGPSYVIFTPNESRQ